jgi:hypothetical protein
VAVAQGVEELPDFDLQDPPATHLHRPMPGRVQRLVRRAALCGLEVTSSQVSRAAGALDEELETWRTRPLGETPYLILDAWYERVRHGGAVVPCAVLVTIGIDPQGQRPVPGVSASFSEVEVHRRDFLASLQARGPHGVRAVVSDDRAGLRDAQRARLTGVPHQLCRSHHLPETATPVNEVDRPLKVRLRKQVRGIRPIERKVEGLAGDEAEAVRGYCAAVRSALSDDGRRPLNASGLKLQGRAAAVATSLDRAGAKVGSRGS